MKNKYFIFVFLIAYLFAPTSIVSSQEDDLIIAANYYAFLIDRSLANTTSTDALKNLRASFDKHMNDAILDYNDVITTAINQSGNSNFDPDRLDKIITRTSDELVELQELHTLILDNLDARIRIAERDERVYNIITSGIIHQTITDGAGSVDPNNPPTPNPIVTNYQTIHAADAQNSALHGLNAAIVDKIPNSSAVVDSMSTTLYDFDAGLPPSSSSVVQQDNEPTEVASAATPTVSPTFPESAPENGGSAINTKKPIRFANDGVYAATVVVNSYSPPPNTFAQDTNASTVVFPGGNSSGQLSLPIGEYSFCYYWELDGDTDNDGYVDYAHTTTGTITLGADSSDSVDSAQVVTLHPENRSTPNGKCGKNILPQPQSDSKLSLTPQELANQGTHTYSCVESGGGGESWTTTETVSIAFSSDGVLVTNEVDSIFFSKIEPNYYEVTAEGWFLEMVYSDFGFTYIYSGDNKAVCTR